MRAVVVLLLVSLSRATCAPVQLKATTADERPYDQLPIQIREVIDNVKEENDALSVKHSLMTKCYHHTLMQRYLLRLLVARNMGRKVKVTSDSGETLEVTLPSSWVVPSITLYRQLALCFIFPLRIMNVDRSRPLLSYN